MVQGLKGPEAWCVTASDGNVVRGMRFYMRGVTSRSPPQPNLDHRPRSAVATSRIYRQQKEDSKKDGDATTEGGQKVSVVSL